MRTISHRILVGILALGLVGISACGDDDDKGNADNNVSENNDPDANNTNNNNSNANNDSNSQANNNQGNNLGDAFDEDCTMFVEPSSDAEENRVNITQALNEAKDGDVLCLAKGDYALTEQLQLNTSDLTGFEIRGESQDETVLDFDGQQGGGNGLLIDGVDKFRAANFTIKNTVGDGIKVQNGDGIELVNLTVTWDRGPSEDNGAYGIYPVLTNNVLIEGCKVSYASDAGIYVGQTIKAIVRNNEAFGNVAGLELENTSFADAYDNHLHDNTGGLLVFDLPDRNIVGGESNKVHNNLIENNNQVNFAASSAIVYLVPQGTGILLLASSKNEIHDNTITGNQSLGVVVASYLATGQDSDDEDYYPYSESNYIHDNIFANNGTNPQGMAKQIGTAPVEDLAVDGVLNPDVVAGDQPFEEVRDCFANNKLDDDTDAPFINANLFNDEWDAFTDCSDEWTDFCHYQCEGVELSTVTLD